MGVGLRLHAGAADPGRVRYGFLAAQIAFGGASGGPPADTKMIVKRVVLGVSKES